MRHPLSLIARTILAAQCLLTAIALAADEAPGEPRWRPCHIGALAERVECVDFDVPLDWNAPEGPRITLHAAVVPALGGRPAADPLVVLAGGPGQAATDYGSLVVRAFDVVRRQRDIVLMDQRGTGRSAALDCPMTGAAFEAIDFEATTQAVRDCARSADIDPRYLTSMEAVRDLERLRDIVGAERVNLWGGSYGTRLAQHYVRAYPDRVRAAVLDAALPAGTALFESAPQSTQKVWDRLVSACEADLACATRFPDLDGRLTELVQRLDTGAGSVVMQDPTTGRSVTVRIDRILVTETIRGALYVPSNAAVVPWAVTRAADGDYGPLAALAHATAGWASETMYVGATLGVLCSEAVPRLDAATARRAGAGTFVGDAYYRLWYAACEGWPNREIDPTWLAPLQADVPALVLSGAMDPVTPPRLGELTAASFSPGIHGVAPHGGHTISALGCAPDLIAGFLEQPDAGDIDTGCLTTTIDPVPFTLGALGPIASGDTP